MASWHAHDDLVKTYNRLMEAEAKVAALAPAPQPEPAPTPIPSAMRPQFTVEFCMWLQNVWAEEIKGT